MRLFNKDMEKEMSGGQVFGYILVIAALLFVISFGIFVALKKAGVDTSRGNEETKVTIEQTLKPESTS